MEHDRAPTPQHEADRVLDPGAPLRETPQMERQEAPAVQAAADAANKLPDDEQLRKFRRDQDAHDGGNQPA